MFQQSTLETDLRRDRRLSQRCIILVLFWFENRREENHIYSPTLKSQNHLLSHIKRSSCLIPINLIIEFFVFSHLTAVNESGICHSRMRFTLKHSNRSRCVYLETCELVSECVGYSNISLCPWMRLSKHGKIEGASVFYVIFTSDKCHRSYMKSISKLLLLTQIHLVNC